jgi:peptidoglycan/xylan/chitin deacetylase (PgdA/CDA1 family)
MRLACVCAAVLLACASACGPSGHIGDDDDDDDVAPDADPDPDPDPDADVGPGPDADPDDPDAGTVNPPPVPCTSGLGAWTGNDNVPPSQDPPCGLNPVNVPQLVALGIDDNGYSGVMGSNGAGGMTWTLDMVAGKTNADGSPVRLSFYMTSTYIGTWISESPVYVKQAWRRALMDGHEVGNHSDTHPHGGAYAESQWGAEIDTCISWVTKPYDPMEVFHTPNPGSGIGQAADTIYGFRTPFLEYNDATLAAVDARGFWYDCSIEDGFQWEHDGTNYMWPYTLDNGSPGHDVLVQWGSKQPITPHPGLWELPVHPVIVPPDDKCAEYGVPPGLRAKLKSYQSWWDETSGKITGFDYNLWVQFKMTKAEFLATLKYTLDLRRQGNRAPFMFGVHSDYYSTKYTAPPNATVQERQEALEEFIDYARAQPEVRVWTQKQILDWVRNPSSL